MSQPLSVPRAWYIAARPHTLPAAATPVVVGAGLAAHDGVFRWGPLVAALVGALAIQVAANFANDASDAARGTDTPDRTGPPRMVALGVISPRRMWFATWSMLALALLAGIYLIAVAGWVIALVGAASVVAMLGYTGGPIPYGYRGLGEVFVFAFFGVAATVGGRYVHNRSAPLDAWILAIPIGFLVTAILVANNLRDIDTDARAGKRTLAVILGRARTRLLFAGLIWGAFAAIAVAALTRTTPPATGLTVLLAPFGAPLIRTARSRTDGPALIGLLKGTARLHLLVGLALVLTTVL